MALCILRRAENGHALPWLRRRKARLSVIELWKAVKVIDGEYYALGMGKATDVHLPVGKVLDGGEHGFACAQVVSAARCVLYQLNRRTVLPIPEHTEIIRVLGEVRETKNWGAVICDRILIP